jgi:hypothetical protein
MWIKWGEVSKDLTLYNKLSGYGLMLGKDGINVDAWT